MIQTYFEISTEELEQTAGYDAELGVYLARAGTALEPGAAGSGRFREVVECKESGDWLYGH